MSQRFAASFIYELPFGRGKQFLSHGFASWVLGNWQTSGFLTMQTGNPISIGAACSFPGATGLGCYANRLKDGNLPSSQRSMNQWFDTTQFLPFPTKNTNISTYPAWTGIQTLPGYSYVPVPSDGISNGVYQDFANFVRTYPNSWTGVRASRVNNVDGGIYKNFSYREHFRLQYRFECYNALNHPRFPAPDTNPASSASASLKLLRNRA